jgi:hypothetical protein
MGGRIFTKQILILECYKTISIRTLDVEFNGGFRLVELGYPNQSFVLADHSYDTQSRQIQLQSCCSKGISNLQHCHQSLLWEFYTAGLLYDLKDWVNKEVNKF